MREVENEAKKESSKATMQEKRTRIKGADVPKALRRKTSLPCRSEILFARRIIPERTRESMLNPLLLSLEIALLAGGLALAIGTGCAWTLAKARFPGREAVDIALTLPLVLPPTVLGYFLLVAIGNRSPIGRVWEAAFGSPLVFTRTAATLAAFVSALPLVVKTARAALEKTDADAENAARLLGASEWRVFRTVTLPLAWRGVAAGAALGFARALGDFGATLMVAGNIPGETQTAALAIYDAVIAGRERDALTLAGALSLAAAVTLYLVNRLSAET
jgi:molybdate transport system permease protein